MLEDGKLSLLQAMETRFNGIQDEVQICKRNRESALVAQDATTMQVLTEVESINLQIGALKGLEKSMVGFVIACNVSLRQHYLLSVEMHPSWKNICLRSLRISSR